MAVTPPLRKPSEEEVQRALREKKVTTERFDLLRILPIVAKVCGLDYRSGSVYY